jgi:hypothetical protein
MLIVNDEQRLRAGIGSLSMRCQYCSKALAAYPLILTMMPGWPSTMPRVPQRSRWRSWSISTPSSARLPPTSSSLFSRHPAQFPSMTPDTTRRMKGIGGCPAPWHCKHKE